MTNSRPDSMIIPPGVFDETNTNNTPNRKSLQIPGHSSTSSIDSTGIKNGNFREKNSSPQNILTVTTSTTTTDSDRESEQDDSNNSQQQQQNDLNLSAQVSRRVKNFHKLFRSEIPNDMPDLIDTYVCAYQGDILLQGKMYITDRYLCFHSRIINYVTKHVYRWEDIENVTKERVAFIFPTAIGILLKKGKKVTYASFLTRDQAYEKIFSLWSRYSNDSHSFDNDGDNDSTQNGTLKATNHNEKKKRCKRQSYDIIDGPESDVLQMYLKPDQRRNRSSHRKSVDDKKFNLLYEKKSSPKTPNHINENIPNTNPTIRHSRFTKNEQKSNGTTKRNSSMVNHRTQSTSRQNHTRDRTLSPVNSTLSRSISTPILNEPITHTNDNGLFQKVLKIIISLINMVIQYVSLLFQSYSIKTTTIILIFLIILFLHSFYLIQLAFRIEDRLHSLHHLWPSSSVKASFSSNSKQS